MLFAPGWVLEIAEGNHLLPDDSTLPVCCSFLMNRFNISFQAGTDECVSSFFIDWKKGREAVVNYSISKF